MSQATKNDAVVMTENIRNSADSVRHRDLKNDAIEVEQIEKIDHADSKSPARTHAHEKTRVSPSGCGPHFLYGVKKFPGTLRELARFMGPGFLISCAYIDPGNYATDVVAGASYRFKLLFIILMSNFFAIFLQSLCVKLGSITGKTLPEMTKEHLPGWLNLMLCGFNETAIIATDMAEVLGFAIAISMLSNGKVPLAAGCALSLVALILCIIFYNPGGSMKAVRGFEIGVAGLVMGVVILFCVQLSMLEDTAPGEVFRGYLPSSALIEKKGLYQACGILGATVMPHSIILGSGLVQSRLRDYDIQHGLLPGQKIETDTTPSGRLSIDETPKNVPVYQSSLASIRHCLPYSVAEVAISLFTFALFVNSAILIVAGADLYNVAGAEDADIFGIQTLLKNSIGEAAGVVFALALLLSGTSAGLVCIMSGQMVLQGQLNWKTKPWVRQVFTRAVSIIPSVVVSAAMGKDGVDTALVVSQVILSCLLPFVSAPLIYFTARAKYMTITADRIAVSERSGMVKLSGDGHSAVEVGELSNEGYTMENHWVTNVFGVIIWCIITVMNVAAIVLIAIGA